MSALSFWITRFTIVGISALISLISIIIISTSGILESLPMKYILGIAVCQLVVASTALVFGICSLEFNISSIINDQHQLEPHHITALVLMTAEGVLFKASQLISFFLITVLTLIIYEALKQRAKTPYEFWINCVGISLSVAMVGLFAGLGGLGFCYADDNYFNFVCINPGYELVYYLLWATPCSLLALATLAMIIHIAIKIRHQGFYRSLPIDFKLVLRIYFIPFFGFVIYVIDLILTTIHFYDSTSVWVTILNNVLFTMPIVTLVTVLVFKKRYLALHSLSFHEDSATTTTDNPRDIQLQRVNNTDPIDPEGLINHN